MYEHESEIIKDLLREFDRELECPSLDEFLIDITDYLRGNAIETDVGRMYVADKIRKMIFDKTKLTASCGIASNKLLAKICSDYNKPNGLTFLQLDPEQISKFMEVLPIKKLQGIGKITEMIMNGLQIYTCQDMIDKATEIYLNFTENVFEFLIKSAMGIGKTVHDDSCQIKKSLSVAETFKPITNYEESRGKVCQLAKELHLKCIAEGLIGRVLSIEYKTTKLINKQKSYSTNLYTDSEAELTSMAVKLFNQIWPVDGLRMIGLKLMDIIPKEQLKYRAY
jgi:DNA polymerase kappa